VRFKTNSAPKTSLAVAPRQVGRLNVKMGKEKRNFF
jgi:hypothetical protein